MTHGNCWKIWWIAAGPNHRAVLQKQSVNTYEDACRIKRNLHKVGVRFVKIYLKA